VNVRRARIRLTLLFIGLFALVIAVLSVVFYAAFAVVLQPEFDIGAELTNSQVAERAYEATIQQVAVALLIADAVAVVAVAIVAWYLARRTLEPIRDAHLRQQRFVADASHETRNPLAAIKSTAESALSGDRTPAELRAALEAIDTAADRLTRLTGDLLVLAQTNDPLAGKRREAVDLSVVVAEAVEGLEPDGPEKTTIQLRLEPGITVAVDPDEIGRIARNLVENAIRYGGPGVTVTIQTRLSDGDAALEVFDDGPGIGAADLARIFEPFYRVTGTTYERTGVGLGLAIARDLAQRNDGRLSVTSTPGSGSVFRLTLNRLR
jgi:signal transduction histidine kinase